MAAVTDSRRQKLFNAVKFAQSLELVRDILDDCPDEEMPRLGLLSETQEDSLSPVHECARLGKNEILLTLIHKANANINSYSPMNNIAHALGIRNILVFSVLHEAIKNKNVDTVDMLIKNGVDIKKVLVCKKNLQTGLLIIPDSPKMPKEFAKELWLRARSPAEKESFGKIHDLLEAAEKQNQLKGFQKRPLPNPPRNPPTPHPILVTSSIGTWLKGKNNLNETIDRVYPTPTAPPPEDEDRLSDTMSSLNLDKELAEKEKELQAALEIQDEMNKITSEIEEEVKLFEQRVFWQERTLRELKKSLEGAKVKLSETRQSYNSKPAFRTSKEIDAITMRISELHAEKESSKRRNNAGNSVKPLEKDASEDWSKCCPVCLDKPQQVFGCQSCDNMICGNCYQKIEECPLCRQCFITKPAIRNKLAERLLSS